MKFLQDSTLVSTKRQPALWTILIWWFANRFKKRVKVKTLWFCCSEWLIQSGQYRRLPVRSVPCWTWSWWICRCTCTRKVLGVA